MCECTCQEIDHIMELFNKLDSIDKYRIQERIEVFLEDEKYSVKRKITDRQNNIITVDFSKK